jgi:hypothetical protein
MKIITKSQIAEANKKLKANFKSVEAHPLVRDVSIERDGIWIYLHDGWCCSTTDMNAISEDTLREAVACLKDVYYDATTLDGEPEISPAVENPYPAGSGSAAQWEANNKWNEACARRGAANERGQYGKASE